jgi:hypothetical protein
MEPSIGLNLFLAVSLGPLYIALIMMGFVIIEPGLSRMLQENRQVTSKGEPEG